MKRTAYCLFETPLGPCGIAWNENQDSLLPTTIAFLQLPEASAKLTDSRMARITGRSKPSELPSLIAGVIEKVRMHLEGNIQDFRDIHLDLEGVGPFARLVYRAAREIPAGETRTYGEIARSLNKPSAARAVGQALGRNPVPILIPCHRVLAAGGKGGGFSAPGGIGTKARILAIEGVTIKTSAPVRAQRKLWETTLP